MHEINFVGYAIKTAAVWGVSLVLETSIKGVVHLWSTKSILWARVQILFVSNAALLCKRVITTPGNIQSINVKYFVIIIYIRKN